MRTILYLFSATCAPQQDGRCSESCVMYAILGFLWPPHLGRMGGQVITAQANFMRILVQWDDLTQLQRETRTAQLGVSVPA